jgi:hypothetical protein
MLVEDLTYSQHGVEGGGHMLHGVALLLLYKQYMLGALHW